MSTFTLLPDHCKATSLSFLIGKKTNIPIAPELGTKKLLAAKRPSRPVLPLGLPTKVICPLLEEPPPLTQKYPSAGAV